MIPMFPKPSQVKKKPEAVKVFRDGREKLNMLCKEGRDEYHRRRLAMWERQGKRCALQITDICKQRQGRWPQDEITYDHFNGRGGGKQDDRIEVDGKPQNAAVCWPCNHARGSTRVPYLVDAP